LAASAGHGIVSGRKEGELRMNAHVMVTSDGWRVELIEVDGRPEWRITQHGCTSGGKAGRVFDIAGVQRRLGDSFALLEPA
jgi:hypothetical protein